jgi:eukaryotic-like serine/threonine-protein kinase
MTSGRTIAGKYTLRREIGRGNMGFVWEAYDQALRRPVAIKLMTPDRVASAPARRRFEREAMTIARLRNKHIVQVHDYGVDGGSPYIVMELLEGEDLEARLCRDGRLTTAAALALLRQIATGLEGANAEGVVHRDLKPANIFISRREPTESVKLLDFGVVRILSEAADDEQGGSCLVGTPSYMSPEQVRGAVPHHPSDLWSLGVIVYRMLTGRLPFSGSSLAELIVSICTDPVPPPSRLVPGLLPGFDAFFERALAKDQAQRFQAAHEFVAAFAALCEAKRGPVKILVVDDEPDIKLLMKTKFRQKTRDDAYQFLFATEGRAALEELRRHPDIDVVLADINMPVMDGLTLLGHIPEVNPLARTVMVSAYGDMGNIRSAMNRGSFDFVLKPIDFVDLEATIEKASRYVAELRKNARSDEENVALRQFIRPALVERIRALGPSVAVAGEEGEATVAFVDVFQFTAVTAEKSAGEALRALNANFGVIVPELVAQGGEIDKFLGDAVMALFQGPRHLTRALEACVSVRAQMAAIARNAGEGSPYEHGVCIGLSTGRVLSGSVGSPGYAQLEYTALGAPVNAAAHLARAALPGEILVDAPVYEATAGEFFFSEPSTRELWPRSEPAVVYNVLRSARGTSTVEAQAATETAAFDDQGLQSAVGTLTPFTPQETVRLESG